jgi:glycosyltransferase involved in cell wall biosynthesis
VEDKRIDRDGLKKYLVDQQIDVVIDQEGIFSDSFTKAFKSLNLSNIKLLTVFHSTPSIYEKLYDHKWLLSQIIEKNELKTRISSLIRLFAYPLWRKVSSRNTAKKYQNIYSSSDYCVMLSSNDIPTLKKYVPKLTSDKCVVIPNALTFDVTSDDSILQSKKNQVLIVARLNDNEKRVSLALKIWKRIEDRGISDWSLTIVGTGPHEEKLKQLAKKLKLNNISFEGRQQSEPYYEKAAIFMMTSAVEGWGLTLTESMQRGVVPLAFDSYPALRDIITNNFNGCIIPDNDLTSYADRLQWLMQNREEREQIAKNALISCQRFVPEKVIEKWIDIIESYNYENTMG